MSVSAIETLGGTVASGSSATPTVTTTLAPTDRLVVQFMKAGTTGVPSVSGLGTWSEIQTINSTRDASLFTATGITGGGTVTVSAGSSGSAGDYVLFVLRGSGGGQVNVFGSQSIRSFTSPATATDITSALSGMFVCACSSGDTGISPTLPGASMLPSSGWTTTRTAVNLSGSFIHQELSANTTVRGSATVTSGAVLIVVGVFSESTTALSSTFVGWGNPIF